MDRRKALKIFGLSSAATATAVVSQKLGMEVSELDKSLEENTVVINGVKSLDVKNTTLYKDFISKTITTINDIGIAVYDTGNSEISEEKIDWLCEFDEDRLVDGDLPSDLLKIALEGLEEMDHEASYRHVDYGEFKSTWLSALAGKDSAEMLLQDFDDEIPENMLEFFVESSELTKNYQSYDFNLC